MDTGGFLFPLCMSSFRTGGFLFPFVFLSKLGAFFFLSVFIFNWGLSGYNSLQVVSKVNLFSFCPPFSSQSRVPKSRHFVLVSSHGNDTSILSLFFIFHGIARSNSTIHGR